MRVLDKIIKRRALASAVMLSLGVAAAPAAHSALTLTFQNNATPDTNPQFTDQTGSTKGSGIAFAPNTEFRVMTPTGTKTNNGFKDVISGGETWTFSSGSGGVLTAVGGTPPNVGSGTGTTNRAPITASLSGYPICATAGQTGCPTLEQNASFLQSFLPFNFLAPVSGSIPGNTYGPATANVDLVNKNITIHFPVLQAQWAGGNYIIGADPNPSTNGDVFVKGAGPGVTMSGPITNVVSSGGTTTFDFDMHGSYSMTADEVTVAGFKNNLVQWEFKGVGSMPTPVVTVQPLSASSGVIGARPASAGEPAIPGNSGGRVTGANLFSVFPKDDAPGQGVLQSCVGGCFDYQVTGIATGAQIAVVLPLSAPIPSQPRYRKFDPRTNQWKDFDTTTVNATSGKADELLSAPGPLGSCPAANSASYKPGLTPGDFCVEMLITDGGVNDSDGIANSQVVDPGGVGSGTQPASAASTGGAASLSTGGLGCSMDPTPRSAWNGGAWWLFGAVIGWLGFGRRRRASRRS